MFLENLDVVLAQLHLGCVSVLGFLIFLLAVSELFRQGVAHSNPARYLLFEIFAESHETRLLGFHSR